MKILEIDTDKWKGLVTGKVVEYQNIPYVIIAIGTGKAMLFDGSVRVEVVVQAANEFPSQDIVSVDLKTKYMHKDKIKVDVGTFQILDDGHIIRITGIEEYKWVLTDLAIKYTAESVPGWSPMKVNKIIQDWRKKQGKRTKVANTNVVKVDFNRETK